MERAAQLEELNALRSVYYSDELEVIDGTDEDRDGRIHVIFRAIFPLPENYLVRYLRDLNSIEPCTKRVVYLPPIELRLSLPEDYPSVSPPEFVMSSVCFTKYEMTALCRKLDEIWSELGRVEILYAWFDFLKNDTLRYLGHDRYFDLTYLCRKHLLFMKKAEEDDGKKKKSARRRRRPSEVYSGGTSDSEEGAYYVGDMRHGREIREEEAYVEAFGGLELEEEGACSVGAVGEMKEEEQEGAWCLEAVGRTVRGDPRNRRRRESRNEPGWEMKRLAWHEDNWETNKETMEEAKAKTMGEPRREEKAEAMQKPEEEEKAEASQMPMEDAKAQATQKPMEEEKAKTSQSPMEIAEAKAAQKPMEEEKAKASQRPMVEAKAKATQMPMEEAKAKATQMPMEEAKAQTTQKPKEEEKAEAIEEPLEEEKAEAKEEPRREGRGEQRGEAKGEEKQGTKEPPRYTGAVRKTSQYKTNTKSKSKSSGGKRTSHYDDRVVLNLELKSPPMRVVEEYDEKRDEIELRRNSYTCSICIINKPGTECTRFRECRHVFCKSCVKEYFAARIREGAVHPLKCPEEDCDAEALPSQSQTHSKTFFGSNYQNAF